MARLLVPSLLQIDLTLFEDACNIYIYIYIYIYISLFVTLILYRRSSVLGVRRAIVIMVRIIEHLI